MTLAGIDVAAVAIGLAAIAFLVLVGRYGLDPMFRTGRAHPHAPS